MNSAGRPGRQRALGYAGNEQPPRSVTGRPPPADRRGPPAAPPPTEGVHAPLRPCLRLAPCPGDGPVAVGRSVRELLHARPAARADAPPRGRPRGPDLLPDTEDADPRPARPSRARALREGDGDASGYHGPRYLADRRRPRAPARQGVGGRLRADSPRRDRRARLSGERSCGGALQAARLRTGRFLRTATPRRRAAWWPRW